MVSEAVRRQLAERERQRTARDAQPDLSGAQAAAVKSKMAAILLPGETVSRAINRLRPAPQHKPGAAPDCLARLPDASDA